MEQHANLMRQCNDLTGSYLTKYGVPRKNKIKTYIHFYFKDGYRQRIALTGELYGKPCYWFITDVDGIWRKIESDWGMGTIDTF